MKLPYLVLPINALFSGYFAFHKHDFFCMGVLGFCLGALLIMAGVDFIVMPKVIAALEGK